MAKLGYLHYIMFLKTLPTSLNGDHLPTNRQLDHPAIVPKPPASPWQRRPQRRRQPQ